MSSRFGRNQKRQLKQQIKDLEYRCALAEGLQHKLGNDLRELKSFVREWDERISEMLHKDSAYLSTPNTYKTINDKDFIRVHVPESLNTVGSYDPTGGIAKTVNFMSETLNKLQVAVDDAYMIQAKRICIKLGARASEYYISESAFDSYGFSEEQLRYISQEIAYKLNKHLKDSK